MAEKRQVQDLASWQRELAEHCLKGGTLRYHIGRRWEGWLMVPPPKKTKPLPPETHG